MSSYLLFYFLLVQQNASALALMLEIALLACLAANPVTRVFNAAINNKIAHRSIATTVLDSH